MRQRIRRSPATVAFLAVVWSLFLLRSIAESRFGEEAAAAVFVVRYAHLEYAWTWVTAPLGHGNVAHLALNSAIAAYLLPGVERTVGFRKTCLAFLAGGAITALLGTVFAVLVRGPFLADAADAGGIGSSMGLFVLVGLLCERYRSRPTPIRGLRRFGVRNATVFCLLLAVSVLGVGFDIWRKRAGVAAPGLGHHYHVVGLLVGWAFGAGLEPRRRSGHDPPE